MYSLSTFWHWSIWLLLFHIAVITPSPDSRYVLISSPDRTEWSVHPCFNPNPEPYWVNIVPSSNEIFTLRVTPGSDLIDHMDRGQPGVKWPSREGFGSSNRKWAQIFSRSFPQTENFIQPNYKLYKFLNYEQFMTWWVLSVWELYYYS